MSEINNWSKAALANLIPISHMWLFKFKFILIEVPFLSHNSQISSSQQPRGAGGYCTGQCTQRTFPAPWKLLLDSTGKTCRCRKNRERNREIEREKESKEVRHLTLLMSFGETRR